MTPTTTCMVYLAPGRGVGTKDWGGWHITLAGRAPYDDLSALRRLVDQCMLAVDFDRPFRLSNWNSSLHSWKSGSVIQINSQFLTRFVIALMHAGVENVRTEGLHITLRDRAAKDFDAKGAYKLLSTLDFHVYIVEVPNANKIGRGVVPDIRADKHWHDVPFVSVTGAGVILLENYNSRIQHRSEPAVILFRSSSNGVYGECGGVRDSNESPETTASRELAEESLGTFRIDVEQSVRRGTAGLIEYGYLAFVLPVKGPGGIRRDVYSRNLNLVRQYKRNLPPHWTETDDMSRFFVSDLLHAGMLTKRGNLNGVSDVYGNVVTVDGRAKAVLREAYKSGLLSLSGSTGVRVDYNDLWEDRSHGIGDAGTTVNSVTSGQAESYRYPKL